MWTHRSAIQIVIFTVYFNPTVSYGWDSADAHNASPSNYHRQQSGSHESKLYWYCNLRGGAPPYWGNPKNGVWGERRNHDPRADPFPDRVSNDAKGAAVPGGGGGGMGSAIMRSVTEAVARDQLKAALKERLKDQIAEKLKSTVTKEVG